MFLNQVVTLDVWMSHLILVQLLNQFKKMHLGYFCGTVQIPIFVIQQAGTSKMDIRASSNSNFVNPCVHRF